MPRSSGGGSRSGGTHHSGGGGGGGLGFLIGLAAVCLVVPAIVKMFKNAFLAAHELITGECTLSSTYDPTWRKIQLVGYITLPIALTLGLLFFMFFNIPINLKSVAIITEPTIEDNINLFTDSEEQQLTTYFEKFYKRTGITVDIVTTQASEGYCLYSKYGGNKKEKVTVEDFAYYSYMRVAASDETHWLLLFATDVNGSGEWYFEGMQGDDTIAIISRRRADKFNTILYKKLHAYGIENLSKCIEETFEETTKRWMWPYVEWRYKEY